MTGPPSPQDSGDVCPFCGLGYAGAPNQCPRCGTLLGEAAHDLQRFAARERKLLRSRKALADTSFLVGLLLGGPIITLGGGVRIGLFIVLTGGLASVLRRYTSWSVPGTVVVGSLLALVVATLVVEPAREVVEVTLGDGSERAAFVSALAEGNPDILVETRGNGHVVVWFTAPAAVRGECGEYPEAEVRDHLRELGFLRVVVADRNARGGLCSFAP